MGKAEKWTTECERNSSRTAQCVLTQKIKMYPTKKLRKFEVQHKYGNYTQSSKRLLPSAEEHNQLFRWENFKFVLFKKLICVSVCCYNTVQYWRASMIDTPEVCLITSPLKQILFPVGSPCPSLKLCKPMFVRVGRKTVWLMMMIFRTFGSILDAYKISKTFYLLI